MRTMFAFAVLVFAFVVPAWGQSEEAPWQATVTGQIEAFRTDDGVAALSFASAEFRSRFEGQPEAFLAAIAGSGYAPIVESRSHSFGTFEELSDSSVLQVVKFVGPNQTLYEAVYQLADEPNEGWRVQGVVLRKEAGIAI